MGVCLKNGFLRGFMTVTSLAKVKCMLGIFQVLEITTRVVQKIIRVSIIHEKWLFSVLYLSKFSSIDWIQAKSKKKHVLPYKKSLSMSLETQ